MKRIVFATGNKGKLKEIREILKDIGYDVVSMKEAGCDVPIVENGKTFEENSLIKARTVEKACGEITLADDSGLEIDALNGENKLSFRPDENALELPIIREGGWAVEKYL